MTEPGDPRFGMIKSMLASFIGTSDLPDWHLVEDWLKWGADLWLDIVPTVSSVIAARRVSEPGWQPSSLQYFTSHIERARVVRVMGAAEKAKVPQREAAERPAGHGSAADPSCACIWCGAPFRPLGARGKKRFCSDRCRAAYHRGCRVWAMRAIDEGQLSMDAIRSASRKPYTAFPGPARPPEAERRSRNALSSVYGLRRPWRVEARDATHRSRSFSRRQGIGARRLAGGGHVSRSCSGLFIKPQ
jgi:hypothetical protein